VAAALAATPVVPLSAAEGRFAGLRPLEPVRFGESRLAEVGDVNGDGRTDFAFGEPTARRHAGVVYVVFGGAPLGRIELASAGFQIIGPRQGARRPVPAFAFDGPPAGAMAGSAVSGAGDVNGDGLADIVVGAPFAGRRGRAFSGSAYVVFGKRTGSAVDLNRLGSGGFRIDGPRREAIAGTRVAGPGDVDGDGRADVVVTTRRAAVYVVRGSTRATVVDLRRLGRRGYPIRGPGDTGAAVSGAGDFNGDGVADIAVGAPQTDAGRRYMGGVAFVVFGGPSRRPVRLDRLGRRGVRIDGEHQFANNGEALAPLGDVNGDGRSELLVGATQVSDAGREYAGAAYVVFGRPGAGRIDLRQPGPGAYRILGAGGDEQARAGWSVAGIDDVNGDGRRDILVGAPGTSRRCSPEEGAAYVVYSKSDATPVDLANLGSGGYALIGDRANANAGVEVAGVGDWNGDGRGDAVVMGADFDGSRERRVAPQLDLVLGREAPPIPPASVPQLELVEPSLRALLGRQGVEARATVSEGGIVYVEVVTSAFGEPSPIAGSAAIVEQPGTTSLRLAVPEEFRPALRRRTRLPVEVTLSHCTAAGHEYIAATRLTLAR
jgi:hypothetical protein